MSVARSASDTLIYPQEKHFKNMRQLTFGGDNAEAYFSFSGKSLSLQITNPKWGTECDQIYTFSTKGFHTDKPQLISTGKGRTTCAYYLPGDKKILYASTHKGGDSCMDAPRMSSGKYVWAIFKEYDIFVADLKGNVLQQLTNAPGYDAEATVSPDGKKIVFTSVRNGDLDLYTMNLDGTDVKQITFDLGYDGGAFFSPDNKKLVFRASRPKTEEEIKNYKDLLGQGLVQPTAMEIYTCNVDGSEMTKITSLGGANWAPYFLPDGKRIIFCTNHHSKSGRQFNLFMVNTDGTGLQQVTYDSVFDSFPIFSPNGKKIVFASNRNNGGSRDTNIFIADWVD